MIGFFDYLWFLLTKPFKRTPEVSATKGEGKIVGSPYAGGTEIERIVRVLGSILDEMKLSVFAVRRAWLIKTAPDHALDLLGSDRGIARMLEEDADSFRQRLLNAFALYQHGGTVQWILLALSVIGYRGSEVLEHRLNGLHDSTFTHSGMLSYGQPVWALFDLVLHVQSYSDRDHDRVVRTVQRWKPAHTMLFRVRIHPGRLCEEVSAADALDLRFVQTLRHPELYPWALTTYNGERMHNGDVLHDGEIDSLSVEVLP